MDRRELARLFQSDRALDLKAHCPNFFDIIETKKRDIKYV